MTDLDTSADTLLPRYAELVENHVFKTGLHNIYS
jgi:hypothetical protein